MTQEDLEDEVTAINSIWEGSMTQSGGAIYDVSVPDHLNVRFRLSFPLAYPDTTPKIVDASGIPDAKNYAETLLSELFVPGNVVVYEFVDAIQQRLESGELVSTDDSAAVQEELADETNTEPLGDPFAGWIRSDDVVDRKSLFTGWAAPVTSVEQAEQLLDQLKQDKRIARATHNITAWRIKTPTGVSYQDADDDGETAAGGRLLHLLTVCFSSLVVVTSYIYTNSSLQTAGTSLFACPAGTAGSI